MEVRIYAVSRRRDRRQGLRHLPEFFLSVDTPDRLSNVLEERIISIFRVTSFTHDGPSVDLVDSYFMLGVYQEMPPAPTGKLHTFTL